MQHLDGWAPITPGAAGDATGPTRGIADGGVADEHGDHNKVGFDCSGLVVYAVAQATDGRIVLPQQDSAQVNDPRGTPVTEAADLQPGDIVQPYPPGHVWIWMGGDNKVVEAPPSPERRSGSPNGRPPRNMSEQSDLIDAQRISYARTSETMTHQEGNITP